MAETHNCNPNKPFPHRAGFGYSAYHSNRKFPSPLSLPHSAPVPEPKSLVPNEEGAQDEDDEAHDARSIPPHGAVVLQVHLACSISDGQVRVAFLVWVWNTDTFNLS